MATILFSLCPGMLTLSNDYQKAAGKNVRGCFEVLWFLKCVITGIVLFKFKSKNCNYKRSMFFHFLNLRFAVQYLKPSILKPSCV